MRPNYPKTQPAYGAWLRRAMTHCDHTPATLAKALCMSHNAVGSWSSTKRKDKFMPKDLTTILVWRVLLDTWPKDKSGKHIPIPTATHSRAKLLRLILENISPGTYTTKEMVTASKGDLKKAFCTFTPTLHGAAIGREISAAARLSGGRIRDVSMVKEGRAKKAAIWEIISSEPPVEEAVGQAESHITELRKSIALMRTQDYTSQSARLCRIEALIETVVSNQAKLLKEWGLE